jgi:hypothetical protein
MEPILDVSTIVKLSDDELPPVIGTDDVEEAAKILLDRGVSLVLISMGGEGAFYATRQFGGSLPRFEIDRVVDATGAGDAFLAATLTHLSESPGWLSDEAAVRVRTWANLHPKVCVHEGRGSRGPLPIVVGTLVLVEVERLPRGERRREPRVLWLWWHGGPDGAAPDLDLLWRAYVRRFDLEHTFRFLKQTLGWTAPRVRHPEQADLWTWVVVAAYTQLRLARPCVADLRLPWERRYDPERLTPVRIRRAVWALLVKFGTPAKPPKPCGRSPGRPKGRLSGQAKRYPALKKSA